ncbi:MAG: hypothetical protein HY810_01090 [Candidatus Omnitrophica bacterium]|nr:hypothetical protein [Candidatus Omnitrophota bacterium]
MKPLKKKKEKAKRKITSEQAFASLIGLLLTLIIIAVLLYSLANNNKNTGSQQAEDAPANPKATLDKAKEAVGNINKQQQKRMQELE